MVSIDFSHTALRRLDFGLLIVFDLLSKLGSMSQVATEMGLTQSAVSHAVARLRLLLDDPLFVRNGAGVVPTARAIMLMPMVRDAIQAGSAVVLTGRSFVPATSSRRFSIAAPDTIIAALAPQIIAHFREAPGCQIKFVTMGRDKAAQAVAEGHVDMAISTFAQVPAETVAQTLSSETFAMACRCNHPALSAAPDLDTFCGLDHIVVSQDGTAFGIVDALLSEVGRTRRVVAVVPQLLLAFAAVAQSNAVVTASVQAARFAAALLDLSTHDLPIQIPAIDVALLRHRHAVDDPAIIWLTAAVIRTWRAVQL